MSCGIALNIGGIVCSCMSTQKGTILKAIIVDFLNLLNRKSYRHSLLFFVLDLVHQTFWYFHLLVSLLHRHCYEILYSEPWPSLVSGPGCTAWPTNVLEGQ